MEVERLAADHIKINFIGQARPECLFSFDFLVANIDYCVSVEIRQRNLGNGQLGPVEYRLSGFHDGLPWHNLLIGPDPNNLIHVYEYNVCANGGTLWSLTGGCEGQEVPDSAKVWKTIQGTGSVSLDKPARRR